MSTCTQVLSDNNVHRPAEPDRRRVGVVLALLGLLMVATAVVGSGIGRGPTPESPAPTGLTSVIDASTVRTAGPTELSVQTMTYVDGQSSGWHTHPGLHLVTVMSGTLTVYGPDCQARTFGPGEVYLGGDRPHLARNDTDAPVEMAVTYVTRPHQAMAQFRVDAAAPKGCPVL